MKDISYQFYLSNLFLTEGKDNYSVILKNQAVALFLTVTNKKIIKMKAGWKSFPSA